RAAAGDRAAAADPRPETGRPGDQETGDRRPGDQETGDRRPGDNRQGTTDKGQQTTDTTIDISGVAGARARAVARDGAAPWTAAQAAGLAGADLDRRGAADPLPEFVLQAALRRLGPVAGGDLRRAGGDDGCGGAGRAAPLGPRRQDSRGGHEPG